MILLDTCVVSEALKPLPDPRVMAWLDLVDEEALYLSVLSLGELHRGVELLEPGKKQDDLRVWMEQFAARFSGRILDVDAGTALHWGRLGAQAIRSGRPMPIMDSLIAACALRHNALLATRNVKDYAGSGVAVYNPWETRTTEDS